MSSDKPEVDNAQSAIDEKEPSSSSDAPVLAAEGEEKAGMDDADVNRPAAEPEKPAEVKKQRSLLPLFLFVLVLLLCAAAAGWYFAQEQMRAQRAEIGTLVDSHLVDMASEISQLRDQLSTQVQRQQNVESSVISASSEMESQLQSLARRLAQVETTGSGDWELAEAEYLLRIANQRLVTSQDIDGAIEMMTAADNIFRSLAYPELNEARRQLVADITRLGLVQPVDYEGIYFALDALLPAVSNLQNIELEELAVESSDLSGFSAYWSRITEALSPYIVINSGANSTPQYLLSDEKISLIKSEIQLQIRQAQLALLAGESEVYKSALSSAASRVEGVFNADDQGRELAALLSQYAERSISSNSLDISGSIRELETVIDLLTRVQLLDSIPE